MDKETRDALDAERKEEEEAKAAARAAEPVTARVLPKGHRKVHKGSHNERTGSPDVYLRGEKFQIGRGVAEELEDRGYVEIEAEEPAADPATAKAKAAK